MTETTIPHGGHRVREEMAAATTIPLGITSWDGNLQEGNPQEGNLQEGNFQEGNLQEENLQEENLQEENLQEENLQEESLRGNSSGHMTIRMTTAINIKKG
jgi:uncharacterized protein YjbI with pentapeptide repeats